MFVGLLDLRRVDAAIGDQALERLAGYLSADPVEAREDDRGRRLVDDHVDAGELFERPDVASVATDDAPLHLVRGQLDQPRGRIGGVLCRQALHRDGEDVAGAPLGLDLRLLLDLAQAQARLLLRLLLDLGDEHLLRLGRAQTGEALELTALNALRLFQVLGLLDQVALTVLEHLLAALELRALDGDRVGLAQGTLLHPRDLLAPGAELVHDRRPVGCRVDRWGLVLARVLIGALESDRRRRGGHGALSAPRCPRRALAHRFLLPAAE